MSAGQMEVKIGSPHPKLGELGMMIQEMRPIAKRYGYNLISQGTSSTPGVMDALFRYEPKEGVVEPSKPKAKPAAQPKAKPKAKAKAKAKATSKKTAKKKTAKKK